MKTLTKEQIDELEKQIDADPFLCSMEEGRELCRGYREYLSSIGNGSAGHFKGEKIGEWEGPESKVFVAAGKTDEKECILIKTTWKSTGKELNRGYTPDAMLAILKLGRDALYRLAALNSVKETK